MTEGGAAGGDALRIAQVSIDSPLPRLDHLFDYRVPPAIADEVRPGVRVKVPLRVAGRVADGFVIGLAGASDAPGRLSDVEQVVSAAPVLAPEVWRLARAVADRAAGTASDVLRIAVPKRQARVEQRWLDAPHPPAPPVAAPIGPDAAALLAGERLAALAPPRLVEVGGEPVGAWAPWLAETATGVVAGGRTAIVVVPDHRDLDQLAAALDAGPAAPAVVRVDAGQPPAERYRQHLAALAPGPHLVIGNRSALYAPAAMLGAILLYGDADPLLDEPLAPYAGARDVALLRQEQSGAGLLLASLARSSPVQRLVRVGWVADRPAPRERPDVVLTPEDDGPARIPSAAWRAVQHALTSGPVLVQVARPGDAALRALGAEGRVPPADAGRTAHDLGRAFPGVRVVVADGEHPLAVVPPDPAIVIATRGAEPRVVGGYPAVLLLDGRRMLARESLWVAEDCLRWWSDAAALAAPGAPVHLVGVSGDVAVALATWRSAGFADRQLEGRRELRFPPSVRLATLTGPGPAVEQAVTDLEAAGAAALVRGDADDGVRVTLRFDYVAGAAVAAAARAALVRSGAARRQPGRGARPAALRIRFDPREPV